jgi:hypothetical protein
LNGKGISPQVAEAIEKIYKNPNPDPKEIEKVAVEYFKQKCQPSLTLSNHLGNIYTGSLFACLISLINNPKLALEVHIHCKMKFLEQKDLDVRFWLGACFLHVFDQSQFRPKFHEIQVGY